MAQSSGPISQGTTSERQFTDVQWRDLFGDEPGVIGDLDGTAYALNLTGGGDVVNVGSTTQISTAKVGGFAHRIPQSSPEPITIPAASGSTRTDIIALRYDPAYTGLPGPVRLVRIAGSTSSIPAYDASPPGVEDLPLWAITRAVGQTLNLATVVRMFPRLAPSIEIPAGGQIPTSSPLATELTVGLARYRREMVSGSAAWQQYSSDPKLISTMAARPTGAERHIGLRVVPLNRPSISFTWNGSFWLQDSVSLDADSAALVPAGAYVSLQGGSWVGTTINGGGGFNVPLPFAFSALPIYYSMWAGDNTSGLTFIVAYTPSATSSTIHGAAWGGGVGSPPTPVPMPSGALIRANWQAVGYNT